MRKFTSKNGRKPSTEARRYVYRVTALMLQQELADHGQWMFGGIDDEFDRRRVIEAIDRLRKEMLRRAEK